MKEGIVIFFACAMLWAGLWIGSCAVYVLAAQKWGF